jgi:hypothetical protein
VTRLSVGNPGWKHQQNADQNEQHDVARAQQAAIAGSALVVDDSVDCIGDKPRSFHPTCYTKDGKFVRPQQKLISVYTSSSWASKNATISMRKSGARDGARTRDLRRDRPECHLIDQFKVSNAILSGKLMEIYSWPLFTYRMTDSVGHGRRILVFAE